MTPFGDLAAFIDHPRITSLTIRPDGGRVVVAVQEPEAEGAHYVSALWEIDPEGRAEPQRLTHSKKGESAPRFLSDGTLLFQSARPGPDAEGNAESTAIWALPERGEATVRADAAGGLSVLDAAADGTLLASTSVLRGGDLSVDRERRKTRKDRGVTAILHTGMPIRYWDHEIGDASPRLVRIALDGDLKDLVPSAEMALANASAAFSNDGATVLTTWSWRLGHGQSQTGIVVIDTVKGRRRTVLRDTAFSYEAPVLAPDGRHYALTRWGVSSFETPGEYSVEIRNLDDEGVVVAELGDLTPTEYVFADDGKTLYVAGDLHSRGAILAVDTRTGAASTLIDDACYSHVHVTAKGNRLFALRSAVDEPPTPVRMDLGSGRGLRRLPAPGAIEALPGRMTRVETPMPGHPGQRVGAWLCVPSGADKTHPAPLMVWIHGGPFGSYNAWSWRWNPWLAVARGYAVLMPDPAMSTGYGNAGLARGWPRQPDVVWREVEALADRAIKRATIDGDRTALLGASFGGFMTNWIAGHSDRFKAIVTHAGLWALDQQHATTDAAAHKVRVHGLLEERPEWYAAYSPHNHVAQIRTPMLVTHGNRDYRVPVSEALRLWWDLVSSFSGRPADMPHRFLQFTTENHWILSPSNARVWWETVLGFCDEHVLGGPVLSNELLDW